MSDLVLYSGIKVLGHGSKMHLQEIRKASTTTSFFFFFFIKYESKNYKTKLAHFVMRVNYSANWQSNLKHCHTSAAMRCILLPWPSTFIPEYKTRSDILYLKPLYWRLFFLVYIGTQSFVISGLFSGLFVFLFPLFFFYLPFAVTLELEVAHLGFTYFTIDVVVDQSGILKRGKGSERCGEVALIGYR